MTIETAIGVLRAGGVIVIPTDTVYGLAVDPSVEGAVDALFALKERPHDKPIPILAPAVAAFVDVAVLDDRASALAEAFWPGPLTIVLDRAPGFDVDLGGSISDGVAVRVPAHNLALELLAGSGPLAVTSANLSGETPAETVTEARSFFGEGVGFYLDGGRGSSSASTVVSLRGDVEVLRDGPISDAQINDVLNGL